MKTTLTILLRASFVAITLAAFGGCGLKGPLVLEQVPVDQSQAPLENSIDQIPLETPGDATQEASAEGATKTE